MIYDLSGSKMDNRLSQRRAPFHNVLVEKIVANQQCLEKFND